MIVDDYSDRPHKRARNHSDHVRDSALFHVSAYAFGDFGHGQNLTDASANSIHFPPCRTLFFSDALFFSSEPPRKMGSRATILEHSAAIRLQASYAAANFPNIRPAAGSGFAAARPFCFSRRFSLERTLHRSKDQAAGNECPPTPDHPKTLWPRRPNRNTDAERHAARQTAAGM